MSSAGDAETPSIAAVLFDFGGVITDSPFDAFRRYERDHRLPDGFIRSVNASNHLENAWARLERNELGFDAFCDAFEAETLAAGGRIDARDLFAMFSGQLRPEMVEAVRRCGEHFKTGLLTNNFVTPISGSGYSALAEVLALFDAVVESSVVGVRKPDERFYLMACEALDVAPRQAVFLDDLGVNLKPARALGMATIKVTDTSSALTALEAVIGIPLR
ncbi:MAG TPA: HAD-IA family hydrolase [Acidimicrobiales bacterium]|nr:HAD-IA family hydrolase [Acidimicrobiales bacterium]